jgi:outer membrane protein OmpA-like peptidoglycan-associated protein
VQRLRLLASLASLAALSFYGCGETAPTAPAAHPTATSIAPVTRIEESAETARAGPLPRVNVRAPADPVVRRPQFAIRSAELNADARLILNDVASTLRDHPEIKSVHVVGHTDSTEPSPEELSVERAKAVVDYLTRSGVEPSRLRAEGKGASMPIGPNQTLEGRESNRRVDFQIETAAERETLQTH